MRIADFNKQQPTMRKETTVKAKNTTMTRWKPVTKYSKAVSNALKTYDRKSFELLCDMITINHPVVRIPKHKTLAALIRLNPREDFLRRLAASNN
jgi:hypothetical protein